jgi:hypothetical protein
VTLLGLLHAHHAVEAALLEHIRAGLTRAEWDALPLRQQHDVLEGDILFAMAPLMEDEILAVLTAYEEQGGFL